jgi:hypothetical protein
MRAGPGWLVVAKGGVLSKYKRLAEALGVRVLDVYRVRGRDGRERDVVRVLDYASGKVVLVDLGGTRETLKFREYAERLVEELRKAGVSVNERIAGRVLDTASKLDAAGPASA